MPVRCRATAATMTTMRTDRITAADRTAARDRLHGPALGDGFGQSWFHQGGGQRTTAKINARQTPAEASFRYTDDTAMALRVTRILRTHGHVDQQRLAELFADAYRIDPYRSDGYGTTVLSPELGASRDDQATYARSLFHGEASLGNGAAIRVAPLDAFFHHDLDRALDQAARSARLRRRAQKASREQWRWLSQRLSQRPPEASNRFRRRSVHAWSRSWRHA